MISKHIEFVRKSRAEHPCHEESLYKPCPEDPSLLVQHQHFAPWQKHEPRSAGWLWSPVVQQRPIVIES